MDRRDFFTALTAGMATPIVAGADTPQIPDKVDGLLVIHLNVGHLPPWKAEAYIDRCKDKFRKSMEKYGMLKWETMWMPCRPPQSTEIEVFVRTPTDKQLKELEPLYMDFYEERPNAEELYQPTCDYVLMMLGAPVVKIELDKQQLDMAVNLAIETVESHFPNAMVPQGWYREMVRMGALARAKIMLGRARSKYGEGVPGVDMEGEPATIKLDGETLLREGNEEYRDWLTMVCPQKDRE